MADEIELPYSSHEVRRVLPLGWSLADEPPTGRKAEADGWQAAVRDGSGLVWNVRVDSGEIREHGRSEALRRAMARVVRRA